MKKKSIATLLIVVVLTAAIAVGGTLAYLTAKTDTVTNTFTVGNVAIDLTEEHPADQTAKMVPGNTIEKDPMVTVNANSEACWLFVKIDKSSNFDNFFETFSVADGWTQGSGAIPSNVYYRQVNSSASAQNFYILAGNITYANGFVTVNGTVTQDMMNGITTDPTTAPTLAFTAYAVQLDNLTAAQAWAEAVK